MNSPIGEAAIRKIAKRSDHRWAHHVAILVGGGETLAVGYNRGSLHAEEMAIRKLEMSGSPKASRLYSIRIRRDGKFGASRPCPSCEALIRSVGIRYVFYNNYDGQQEKMIL